MLKIAKLLQILAELFLLGVCGFVAHGPDPFQKIGSCFVCMKRSIKQFSKLEKLKKNWTELRAETCVTTVCNLRLCPHPDRGPFAKQSKTVPPSMPQHSSNVRELYIKFTQMSSTLRKNECVHWFPFPPCFLIWKNIGICHMCLPRRELELGCWALGWAEKELTSTEMDSVQSV